MGADSSQEQSIAIDETLHSFSYPINAPDKTVGSFGKSLSFSFLWPKIVTVFYQCIRSLTLQVWSWVSGLVWIHPDRQSRPNSDYSY